MQRNAVKRDAFYKKLLLKEDRVQREEQENRESSTCGCLSFLFKPKKKGMDRKALIERQQRRARELDAATPSQPIPVPGRFK
jgi:hypothetical protein